MARIQDRLNPIKDGTSTSTPNMQGGRVRPQPLSDLQRETIEMLEGYGIGNAPPTPPPTPPGQAPSRFDAPYTPPVPGQQNQGEMADVISMLEEYGIGNAEPTTVDPMGEWGWWEQYAPTGTTTEGTPLPSTGTRTTTGGEQAGTGTAGSTSVPFSWQGETPAPDMEVAATVQEQEAATGEPVDPDDIPLGVLDQEWIKSVKRNYEDSFIDWKRKWDIATKENNEWVADQTADIEEREAFYHTMGESAGAFGRKQGQYRFKRQRHDVETTRRNTNRVLAEQLGTQRNQLYRAVGTDLAKDWLDEHYVPVLQDDMSTDQVGVHEYLASVGEPTGHVPGNLEAMVAYMQGQRIKNLAFDDPALHQPTFGFPWQV